MRKIAVIGLLAALCGLAQPRRGVTAEDYFAFETAGDPQLAPDGKTVAYTVTTIDQKTNRRMSRIWVAPPTAATAPAPFTARGRHRPRRRDGRPTAVRWHSSRRATAAARRSGRSRARAEKRAASEPGEWRVRVRVVAGRRALRLRHAHRSADRARRATSGTTRTPITSSTTPAGSTISARTSRWSTPKPARR